MSISYPELGHGLVLQQNSLGERVLAETQQTRPRYRGTRRASHNETARSLACWTSTKHAGMLRCPASSRHRILIHHDAMERPLACHTPSANKTWQWEIPHLLSLLMNIDDVPMKMSIYVHLLDFPASHVWIPEGKHEGFLDLPLHTKPNMELRIIAPENGFPLRGCRFQVPSCSIANFREEVREQRNVFTKVCN